MLSDSTYQRTIQLLIKLEQLDQAIEGVNDYGEITGFSEECDSIANDFDTTLRSVGKRSADLLNRLKKYQRNQENDSTKEGLI